MSTDGPAYLRYPFEVAGSGTPRLSGSDDHLRELILQVLLTEPGERVNLPEFGCGVNQLVFAPNDPVMAATVQFLVAQNLQRWLGDRLDIKNVLVTSESDGSELRISIDYAEKSTAQSRRLVVGL